MNDKEMIEEKLELLHDWSNNVYKHIDKRVLIDKLEKGGFVEINRLYNLGYRKLPENAVVLTKEEYEKFKSIENTIKRFSTVSPTEAESENKALKEEIAIILAQKRNIWNSYNQLKQEMEWQINKQTEEELDRVDKQARKETAREILNEIILIKGADGWRENEQLVEFVNKLANKIEELAKRYGVEVGE